jgi:hypothetical protein
MRIAKIFSFLVVFACLFVGTYASAENPRIQSTLPKELPVFASVVQETDATPLNTQLVLRFLVPGTISQVYLSAPGAGRWTSAALAKGPNSKVFIWGFRRPGSHMDVKVTVTVAGETGDVIVYNVPMERNAELTIGSE